MVLSIIQRFSVVKDDTNHYRSFPTAALNHKGEVLVVYRDAFFHGAKLPKDYAEHGIKGDMFLVRWNTKSGNISRPKKIYDHRTSGSNEQNAILSGSGSHLSLFSRQYGGSNRVFYSHSKDGGGCFSKREEVVFKELAFLACYGRVRDSGRMLIAPCYGVGVDFSKTNERCGAGWFFADRDNLQWRFGGWISKPVSGGPSFNETALIETSSKKWFAVLRSGEGRELLYFSHSKNGLKGWSRPKKTGFRGEAPELYYLGKGLLGLTYRGFTRTKSEYNWSLRVSRDEGLTWGRPIKIDTYKNSRFHGGYGDLVGIGDGRFFGVSYCPGSSGLPGIKGVVIQA